MENHESDRYRKFAQRVYQTLERTHSYGPAFATESSDEQDCDFGGQLAANVRTALVLLWVVKRLSRKLRNIPA